MPDYMNAQITGYFIVFCRLGAMLMLMPAVGDENIPPQVRLIFGLLLTLIIYPTVLMILPAMPTTLPGVAALIISETLVGLMIGAAARILFSSIQLTGTIISVQSGLSAAMVFDPTQGAQTVLLGRFVAMLAVVLLFVTEMHHLLLGGMARSYALFKPGDAFMAGDFAALVVRLLSQSFEIGLQLAAPFLVYGLIFNVGLGLLARLTPQIQVFFIAQPLGILLSMGLLLATLGLMMTMFLSRYGDAMRSFLVG